MKTRLRILDAIEKMRKALSADTEAIMQIDSIVNEEDFIYEITRDRFNDLIEPFR